MESAGAINPLSIQTMPPINGLGQISNKTICFNRTPSPDSACEKDWAPSNGQTTSSHLKNSYQEENNSTKERILHPTTQVSSNITGSVQQDSDEDSGILTSEICYNKNDAEPGAEKTSLLPKILECRDQKRHLMEELHPQTLKPSLKKSASCASEASSLNMYGTDSRRSRKKAQLSLCSQFSSLQRVRFDDELPLSEQSIRKSCRQLYAALYTQKEGSSAAIAQQKSESCCNLIHINHPEKIKPSLSSHLATLPTGGSRPIVPCGGNRDNQGKPFDSNLHIEVPKEALSSGTMHSFQHSNSGNMLCPTGNLVQKASDTIPYDNSFKAKPTLQNALPVSAVLKKSMVRPVIYKSSSVEGFTQQSVAFKEKRIISTQQDDEACNSSRKRSISCNVLGGKLGGLSYGTSENNDIIKVQAKLASVIPDGQSNDLPKQLLPCSASSVKSLLQNNSSQHHSDPISDWARGLCISTDSVFYSDEKGRLPPPMGPVSAMSDIHLHTHSFPYGFYESLDYMQIDSSNGSESGMTDNQQISKSHLRTDDAIYDEPKSLLPSKNMHKSDSAIHQPNLNTAKKSFLYCVQSLARSVRHTFYQAFGGEKAYHPQEGATPSSSSSHHVSFVNRLRRSMSLRAQRKTKKSTKVSKSHSLSRSRNDHCPPTHVSGQLIQLNPDRSQVVELTRPPDQPFGFYLAKGILHNSAGYFISRMKDKETQSQLSGLLAVGDEVLQIDGKTIHNADITLVTKLMSEKNVICLTIMPNTA